MCDSFLIQAHSAIKNTVNMWKMFAFAITSVIILLKILHFLYHDIPFVTGFAKTVPICTFCISRNTILR